MATQKYSVHSVGNLNSRDVRTIPEVMAGENLENYTLGELYYDSGIRKVKTLTDATKESVLICAVEVLYDGEALKEYYPATSEYIRVIHNDKGVRFETSSYTGTPTIGQFASWDSATKKFKMEAVESATAKNTFTVVDILSGEYGFGLPMVRLEIKK